MDKLVVNLSDFDLTEDQRSLLSKGLKFCPTPQPLNPGDCRTDLDSTSQTETEIQVLRR